MKRNELVWGGLLIVGGLVLLFQNLGLLPVTTDLFWMLAFGVAGLGFLGFVVRNTEHWWALIPGFALLGIAGTIAVEQVLPGMPGWIGGTLFLGMLGLGFWAVYIVRPRQWWAIIPAGVLTTLALVAGMESRFTEVTTGAVFFFGLAGTFALLFLLPTTAQRQRWAIFPALGALAFAVLILTASEWLLDIIWPAALILGGLYLLLQTFRKEERPETIEEGGEERRAEPTIGEPQH